MNRWLKLDRTDGLSFLLIYPAVIGANNIIFGPAYFTDKTLFVESTIIINVSAATHFLINTGWINYMRIRFGGTDQFVQRLLYSMLGLALITVVMTLLLFWLYDRQHLPYKLDTLPWIVLVGFAANIISAGILEAIFTYGQLRQSTQREIELKRLHLQQQMEVLKQQINPHFLFNSLNSLIALIGENPQQAETFAEELSSVYRYVLRTNEQDLTHLATELDFIHSYAHLLRTRHGSGFQLITHIDPRFNQYQLPSLTLQLLVENAVKHNIVLSDQPLIVEIHTDDLANLHVRNNIQPKMLGVVSNGVGLSNIMAKYNMLEQPTPQVRQEAGQFTVALPLIPA